MQSSEVGIYWEENAAAWIELSRAGYDTYRDALNTPAFLALLPDVSGQRGLDIGCGEGTNTRHVARLGAQMTGVDIAPSFIEAAQALEDDDPTGTAFQLGDGTALPFPGESFDFATAFMS
ncbi:MAG: class I SAM-dependent methyltransferase, partial [Pseudomonadota bacterium]